MSQKKRKSLDQSESVTAGIEPEAVNFVFGNKPTQEDAIAPSEEATHKPKKSRIMERIAMPEKEPTIRLTVDMPHSMHTKLSILCAKSGRKKADVVRMLLEDALEDISIE